MGGQAAEAILASLAQLPSSPLPGVLFAGVAEALEALEAAGDLEREGERVRVPDAVRERVLAELDYQQSQRATDEVLALVLAAFPGDPGDPGAWRRCRELMPALRAAARRAMELDLESPRVPLALALGSEFMTAAGEFLIAEELANAAFAHASASLAPEIQATMNHALGVILIERGELDSARRALEEARTWRAQAGESAAAARRADLLALGEVLGELGELPAAREHLEHVRTDGEVPVDRFDAQARRRLAWLLMEEGELEPAEHAYRTALEATEKLLDEVHPDVAQARGELGAVLLEGSRWEDARAELAAAMEGARTSLGARHPAVGVIASNLGGALEGLENFKEAREAVELSLEIGCEVLPEGHRNLWLRHRKLARILRALDELQAAREHAEKAASISREALPREDPEAARDQLSLAVLLSRLDEPQGARSHFEKALPVLEAAEGSASLEVAEHQLSFGALLVELDDLVAARPPLERALASSESPDDSISIRARIELLDLAQRLAEERAVTLDRLGRVEDAEQARAADREVRRAVLEELMAVEEIGPSLLAARAAGAAMPDLAGAALDRARELAEGEEDLEEREQDLLAVRLTWSMLGLDAFMDERFEESRRFYETALELAAGDPSAEGEVLDDLADIASAEGDEERAVELYRDALARKREGGGDPAYTLLLLGRTYKRLERYEEAEAAFGERLELLREGPERALATAVTLHDLADVRLARGEVDTALDLYGEAAELKREVADPEELAGTLCALGHALQTAEMFAESADAYAECVRLLRGLPEADPALMTIALQEFADLRRVTDDLEAAADLYREALDCDPDDPSQVSYLLFGLASVLRRLGDLQGAEWALRRRLEILADLEGVNWQEGITLGDLGRVREKKDDLPGAIGFYREAAAKLASEGASRIHGFTVQRLAEALAKSDELDEAVAFYEEAFAIWSEGGEPDLASRVLLDLGRAQYELNDLEAAAASFEKRIDLLGQGEERNPRAEGFTLHNLADVRRAEKKLPEAISLYREAVVRKREGEGDVGLAGSLLMLATTLLEADKGKEALPLTEEAVLALRAEKDPDPTLLGSAIALFTILGGGEGPQLPRLEEVRDLYERAPEPSLLNLAGVKTLIATRGGLAGKKAAEARAEAVSAITAALADSETAVNPDGIRLLVHLSVRLDDRELIAAGVERLRVLAEDEDAAEARGFLVEVLQMLGRKATEDGDLGDAEEYFREQLSLLAEQSESGPNIQGITKHDLARALGLAGRSDEAIALYREAAELKREAGNELGVARTLFALAVELRKENDEEAREVAARSVELFRKQSNAGPAELSAAFRLLALLEDDEQRARAALGEARKVVESMSADTAQIESEKQRIEKAEQTIKRRSERPA